MVHVAGLQTSVAGKPQPGKTAMLRALAPEAPLTAVPKAPPDGPFRAKDLPQTASPPPAPRDPVLPVPPRDDEKFRYVRRNAWMLTLFSAASFPLLLFSQVRLMIQYHWFWVYSPCILLAALFLALPLLTDGLSRSFDFGAHRRLVSRS